MALIECKKCGKQISDQAKFCVHCGEPVQSETKLCPACKTANPPDARFCSNCGFSFNANNQPRQSNPGGQKTRKDSGHPPKWPIAAISIALIAVIAFLAYGAFIAHPQSDSIVPPADPVNPTATITIPASPSQSVETADISVSSAEVTESSKSGTNFYEVSVTEIAYNEIHDMTYNDYEKLSNGSLRYKSRKFKDGMSVIIRKEDRISVGLNMYFTKEGALYNSWTSMAASIVNNWKDEKSYELSVVDATVGSVPGESRSSRLERLSQFCEQMPPDIDDMNLLDYLNEKGVVSNLIKSGEDVEYEIKDLKAAAKTLGISERMLGYVIAYIGGTESSVGGKATFTENSVHVAIHKIDIGEIPPYGNTITIPNSITDASSQQSISNVDNQNSSLSVASVGSIVTFGRYEQDRNSENGKEPIEWLVLSNDSNYLMLLSSKVLDEKAYSALKGTPWKESDIRNWLNSDFYNTAFNDSEKAMIVATNLPEEGVSDYVFLLSKDEAYYYFPDIETRKAEWTPFARTGMSSEPFAWLLRTSAEDSTAASVVFNNTGKINETAGIYNITSKLGVRPAIYLRLSD